MSNNTTYFHGGNGGFSSIRVKTPSISLNNPFGGGSGSFFRAHSPHSSIAYSGFGVKSFGISSGNHLTYFGSQDTEDTDF